jgi:hypothetical protein
MEVGEAKAGLFVFDFARVWNDKQKAATTAGWGSLYIPTLRKGAKDGAPDGLWLVEENRQKQRRNAGVLRCAQNDKKRGDKKGGDKKGGDKKGGRTRRKGTNNERRKNNEKRRTSTRRASGC